MSDALVSQPFRVHGDDYFLDASDRLSKALSVLQRDINDVMETAAYIILLHQKLIAQRKAIAQEPTQSLQVRSPYRLARK